MEETEDFADDWCWVPREPGIVPSLKKKKNYFIYLKNNFTMSKNVLKVSNRVVK